MGPTSFIMILIGCANGGNQCAPISTLPVAYQSESHCLAARRDIVSASSGFGYDRVIAECRRSPTSTPHKAAKQSATVA